MAAIDTPIVSASSALENASESAMQIVELKRRILSVSGSQSDHTALRRIVDDTQWWVATVDTWCEARQKLPYVRPLAIFSESFLPDGTWKDVLELISTLDEPPVLVVTSRLADDFLWCEVLNLGGYDVLLKPLITDEVRRVLVSISHRDYPYAHTRVLPTAS